MNLIYISSYSHSATTSLGTCTDRAIKDGEKKEKKKNAVETVCTGGWVSAFSAKQETQGQDVSAALHGGYLVGEETEDGEVH